MLEVSVSGSVLEGGCYRVSIQGCAFKGVHSRVFVVLSTCNDSDRGHGQRRTAQHASSYVIWRQSNLFG